MTLSTAYLGVGHLAGKENVSLSLSIALTSNSPFFLSPFPKIFCISILDIPLCEQNVHPLGQPLSQTTVILLFELIDSTEYGKEEYLK